VSYVISVRSSSTCADELPGMDDGEKSGSVTRIERMVLKKNLHLHYEPDCF
jgi:hypothetical protein